MKEPPETNQGKTWTDEDVERMLHYSSVGASLEETAQKLGRSPGAVLGKMDSVVAQRLQWKELCAKWKAMQSAIEPVEEQP